MSKQTSRQTHQQWVGSEVPARMAATLRYVESMFEHAPQTLMIALMPGPIGVL